MAGGRREWNKVSEKLDKGEVGERVGRLDVDRKIIGVEGNAGRT